MRAFEIREHEAGQTLLRYLKKVLPLAPEAFLHKMLRKKNITLNGKKADGREKLAAKDEVKFFLSEETFGKFAGGEETSSPSLKEAAKVPVRILYEDRDVLLVDKPAGILSQPDDSGRPSMGEVVTSYLLSSGALTREDLRTFRPGVCNRLDFNTSGILAAGKTHQGLKELSEAFRSRTLTKEYLALVEGELSGERILKGYLHKDGKCNKVVVLPGPREGAVEIETHVRSLSSFREASLVKVRLVTGKSHQIRAHLASIGHPLLGDQKYGGAGASKKAPRQMLHAFRLRFPEGSGLPGLSGKCFTAELPEDFQAVLGRIQGGE